MYKICWFIERIVNQGELSSSIWFGSCAYGSASKDWARDTISWSKSDNYAVYNERDYNSFWSQSSHL